MAGESALAEAAAFSPSPAAILQAVDRYAFAPLIQADAWPNLIAISAELPIFAHTICFECRLAEGSQQTDLAFLVIRDANARVLGERLRAHSDPACERFAAFLDAWSSPGTSWAWRIPFVCVAFDGAGSSGSITAPCVSLCVDSQFFAKRVGFVSESATDPEVTATTADCYLRLTGEKLGAETQARMDSLIAPRSAAIAKHVSIMLPRANAPLKLDVRLHIDALAAFLGQIGWPGSVPAIVSRLRALVPWSCHVQLNLVLHPEGASLLEVELFTGTPELPAQARFAFLRKLVGAGLCTSDKAAVLEEAWRRPTSRLSERVSIAKSWYVKVRFGAEDAVDAKAYLALMPKTSAPAVRDGGASLA